MENGEYKVSLETLQILTIFEMNVASSSTRMSPERRRTRLRVPAAVPEALTGSQEEAQEFVLFKTPARGKAA